MRGCRFPPSPPQEGHPRDTGRAVRSGPRSGSMRRAGGTCAHPLLAEHCRARDHHARDKCDHAVKQQHFIQKSVHHSLPRDWCFPPTSSTTRNSPLGSTRCAEKCCGLAWRLTGKEPDGSRPSTQAARYTSRTQTSCMSSQCGQSNVSVDLQCVRRPCTSISTSVGAFRFVFGQVK